MAISAISPLFPRRPVPSLSVATVDGGQWTLADQHPEHFTLVVVYRGLHCPICAAYLRDLDARLPEFARRGVSVVAISSDDAARAATAKEKWKLGNVTVGWGLDLDTARRWGLYISSGHGLSGGIEEPAMFVEPGLFLIRPDGTLYFASVQTMPFARPTFVDILGALDFVVAKNYPARGEVPDPVVQQDAI